jgi:hypothetical protein
MAERKCDLLQAFFARIGPSTSVTIHGEGVLDGRMDEAVCKRDNKDEVRGVDFVGEDIVSVSMSKATKPKSVDRLLLYYVAARVYSTLSAAKMRLQDGLLGGSPCEDGSALQVADSALMGE